MRINCISDNKTEEKMIYKLPEIISKETIFNQILPEITKQYNDLDKTENICISLVQTERINSNALPLFIGMLNLLQNKRGEPVYLELTYNPRFLAFLDTVGFFNILSKNGIIRYDEDYVGGLSEYSYNKDNKILLHVPIKNYKNKSEKEKQEIRDKLADQIRGCLAYSYIFKRINNDQLWNVTLTTSIELIVNGIIHSGSMSFTYMQSGIVFSKGKIGYLLSVVDVGKGFYASLSEKIKEGENYTQKEREFFYQSAYEIGINVKEEINFLSIMEALYYSEKRARETDLFKLKNLLAVSNANFRIHQRNKEVVFTYEKCSECTNRSILHCVKCIWERRNIKAPSIRTYPVAMAGVHIEVEFIQEK